MGRQALLFRAPRGTKDILPEEQREWRAFEAMAQETASRFGYQRIDTPLFEDARLFTRGIGEVTDVVEKETYTFEDRGSDLLTLRPEGTAPVCRAYLEHGMQNRPQPVRLYYLCPVFRYERPQSGRYRQHHQFGVEALGDADSSVDAEVIEIAWRVLDAAGLVGLTLSVNSIGDLECRPAYVRQLQAYYRPHTGALCDDCRRRLDSNPLRLLDCKQESCQPVIEGAPPSVDFLCRGCADHWTHLLGYLDLMGLAHSVDKRLVRGFDYYTRTVFEITPSVEGRQSTVAGGGRYDGLIEELGGRPTPGVGFGMGIERVLGNARAQGKVAPAQGRPKVVVAHLGDAAKLEAMRLASVLRRDGMTAVLAPTGRGLRAQLRYASAEAATHAVIIGEDELARGLLVLRDLAGGVQKTLSAGSLLEALRAL